MRRELREQSQPLGQGVGPGLGNVDGQPSHQGEGGGDPSSDARSAFRDLSPVVERALTGPSGKAILSEIVMGILNNEQVPDAIKQELKSKVGQKWAGMIDLNQGGAPEGAGSPQMGHTPDLNTPGSVLPNQSAIGRQ